jgi:hypothetical protein
VVRTFDLATGKPGAQIKVDGASFLNDVTVAPDGTVYVSDTGLKGGKDGGLEPSKKDAIYKLTPDGKAVAIIKGEQLGLPNGLYADAKGLSVVSWSGQTYRVSFDGKQEAGVAAPGAELDGVVEVGGGQFLISSWKGSAVYLQAADGTFSPLIRHRLRQQAWPGPRAAVHGQRGPDPEAPAARRHRQERRRSGGYHRDEVSLIERAPDFRPRSEAWSLKP